MRIRSGAISLLGITIAVVWFTTAGPAHLHAVPDSFEGVRYEGCLGWGLCMFRVSVPVAQTVPAPPDLAGTNVRIRLRGVGDPELPGVCNPEREAARTIRQFVEGVLARGGRIDLEDIEPGPKGSVLATVRVDGTDIIDILIHIGLGRQKPLPPAAQWCD